MDTTSNEAAATPNLEGPQDAAVGQSEAIRELARLLRAGVADREPGGANLDAEDLQDAAVGGPEAADQDLGSANLDAEDPQDADDDVSEAADQEPGGATKCAYCDMGFVSGEPHQMIAGKLYHGHFCAKFAKPLIAITA